MKDKKKERKKETLVVFNASHNLHQQMDFTQLSWRRLSYYMHIYYTHIRSPDHMTDN